MLLNPAPLLPPACVLILMTVSEGSVLVRVTTFSMHVLLGFMGGHVCASSLLSTMQMARASSGILFLENSLLSPSLLLVCQRP